jgi:tetratricopeptide (TPR) repeat protein
VTDEGQEGEGPPKLERVKPAAPGASFGLNAPTVTAAAAIAAGLPFEGRLEQNSALHLCYLAAAVQGTGRLDIDTDRGCFTFHYKRGVIEHASSNAPEDDLGAFLVDRGVVKPEAVVDAGRMVTEFSGDLVAALANLRLMNPAESFRTLQEHGNRVVARALAAERGVCRWDPTAKAPQSAFPIGSKWGVLCDAARKLDGLAVRKLLGDRAHRRASRAGGRVDLAELKLNAQEARAASLFNGSTTAAQVAEARPGEVDVVYRTALLLGEAELLAFGDVVSAPAQPPAAPAPSPAATPSPAAPPPAPAAAPAQVAPPPAPAAPQAPASARPAAAPPPRPPAAKPAPPKPAAPAAAPAPVVDAAAMRAFHDKIKEADHFEALGMKREATGAQIKIAYFQLAKVYHPDAGQQGESEDLKKLRADIFARLGEAWGVLGDEGRRAAYVQELASGGKPDVDVSAIFKAEELFQKATVYVKTRQYDKALPALREAAALNDEPEFGVWIAWVEFLTASDQKRQHAASAAAIEAALKKVPRCMPGYLFLGQMGKLVGQLDLAEKHLKRGLALDPDHADLTRELKYLRK